MYVLLVAVICNGSVTWLWLCRRWCTLCLKNIVMSNFAITLKILSLLKQQWIIYKTNIIFLAISWKPRWHYRVRRKSLKKVAFALPILDAVPNFCDNIMNR